MSSDLYLDLTHLSARLWTDTPAGIDRVDRTFAELTAHPDSGFVEGVHLGPRGPRAVSPSRTAALLRRIDKRWRETGNADDDAAFVAVRRWLETPLTTGKVGAVRFNASRNQLQRTLRLHTLYRHSFSAGAPAFRSARDGSIYLNVAQWALGEPGRYAWLAQRPRIKPVFFVHDTLPLDMPQFFQPHVPAQHLRIAETLARYARGLITASHDVASRIAARLKPLTADPPPILVAPPPPFEKAWPPPAFRAGLAASPYFVTVGTIEPRKNHLLLLRLWREMAKSGGARTPRLLLIGARGWNNADVLDMLAHDRHLSGHVAEVNGLSSAAVRSLVAHSAGLLFPSFAEGFGLPLAEAVSLGTPTVASDIAVFRETSRGEARFVSPADSSGWREAVESLAADHRPEVIAGRIAAAAARPSGHDVFFENVLGFLRSL